MTKEEKYNKYLANILIRFALVMGVVLALAIALKGTDKATEHIEEADVLETEVELVNTTASTSED